MISEIIKVNTFLKCMDRANTSLRMARHTTENGSKIRSMASARGNGQMGDRIKENSGSIGWMV